ncbi:MAG: phytoene/squalene synthase family protein [Thiohalorhabdus sp.]|uniref:phytoene/squalene synthase family protein n=1 Tax=Thiohalorhabdus sp. TaxID=3094134 RepID=UPI0039807EC4
MPISGRRRAISDNSAESATLTEAPDPKELLNVLARSFALTLRLLPPAMGDHFARAYLFARAADTVADTDAVDPAARSRVLETLADTATRLARGEPVTLEPAPLGPDGGPQERTLLERLPDVARWVSEMEVPARKRAGEVAVTLIGAMREDLERFAKAGERVVALPDEAALEAYLYGNAGCVGGYWAKELAATSHRITGLDLQNMEQSGIRLGKALQRVNVLRDLAKDVRQGRCYLPESSLSAHGLEPRDLFFPDAHGPLRPILDAQIAAAHADLEAGLEFFHHLPHRWLRRRAAAALPAVLAKRTLDRIEAQPERLLDAQDTIKVPRGEVYRILVRLLLLPPSDRGLARMVRGRNRR